MLQMLSYFSSAKHKMSDAELTDIVNKASINNKKLGVTGLLCYSDGNFLQFLEGEEDVLHALYQKITTDKRHKDFWMIMDPIQNRTFDKWYMSLRNVDSFEGIQKDLLVDLLKINSTQAFENQTDTIKDTLEIFMKSFR